MSSKKTESIKRAIQTAAQMFAERPFEEVQIAEIAARARCSSATIHAAFATKKGLFREALTQQPWQPWPAFVAASGKPTLVNLMDHLLDRIAGHSDPALRNLLRSMAVEAPLAGTEENIQSLGHLGEVVSEVQRCMEAGLLRKGDPQAFAYVMLASSGYEAVMFGLLFGVDASGAAPAILEAVLSPLVTERGCAELTEYIDRARAGQPAAAASPSLLRYLRNSIGPSTTDSDQVDDEGSA